MADTPRFSEETLAELLAGYEKPEDLLGKGGILEQLTKALAVELSPRGVRVNAIAPGNIRTPMNEELLKSRDWEQMYLDGTPYGRIGVVEDVAPLAVFLASGAARYIHGESILVDGGWAAQ